MYDIMKDNDVALAMELSGGRVAVSWESDEGSPVRGTRLMVCDYDGLSCSIALKEIELLALAGAILAVLDQDE